MGNTVTPISSTLATPATPSTPVAPAHTPAPDFSGFNYIPIPNLLEEANELANKGGIFSSYTDYNAASNLITKEILNKDKQILKLSYASELIPDDLNFFVSLQFYNERMREDAPRPNKQIGYKEDTWKRVEVDNGVFEWRLYKENERVLPSYANSALRLYEDGQLVRATQLALQSGLDIKGGDYVSGYSPANDVPYGDVTTNKGKTIRISPKYYNADEA